MAEEKSINYSETILKVTGEGGSILITGIKRNGAWRFSRQVNDSCNAFLDEDDQVTIDHYSQEYDDFTETLAAFGKYEWHLFNPTEAHPEFVKQIYTAVMERFNASDEGDFDVYRRKEWHQFLTSNDEKEEVLDTSKDKMNTGIANAKINPLDIVYVLTNPVMPGLVKIGYTKQKDAKIRIDQLYTTGVPIPFDICYACKVPNAEEVETALHIAFAPARINPKREFFKIDPEQAIAILKLLHTVDATEEVEKQPTTIDQESAIASQQVKAKRPNMDFIEMDIPLGAVLTSIQNSRTAIVSTSKKVIFDGAEMSLTAATRILFSISHSIQPSPHWTYNGRSLKEIYEETYGSDD
jgi:hypothetical protein